MKKLSETAEEVVYKTKRKVIGIECDICGKVLEPPANGHHHRQHYFEVTTGHHDWGNDSWESIYTQDICPDCIVKFMTEYVNNADNTSRYLDLETKHISNCQYEYE